MKTGITKIGSHSIKSNYQDEIKQQESGKVQEYSKKSGDPVKLINVLEICGSDPGNVEIQTKAEIMILKVIFERPENKIIGK